MRIINRLPNYEDLIQRTLEREMNSEISDAVYDGNYDLVVSLLKKGHDINWKDGYDITLLMTAAVKGNVEITKLLIEQGADIYALDMNGLNAIDYAKKYHHENLIEIIQTTQKKKKEGCYIATEIYGSYNSPEVLILRKFRDSKLLTNQIGSIVVKIYYRVSPIFVKYFRNKSALRMIIKTSLDSFIYKYKNKLNPRL